MMVDRTPRPPFSVKTKKDKEMPVRKQFQKVFATGNKLCPLVLMAYVFNQDDTEKQRRRKIKNGLFFADSCYTNTSIM